MSDVFCGRVLLREPSVKLGSSAKMTFGRRLGRLPIVGFMLLSLLFQSYVTQTHIHPLGGIPGITALKLVPPAPGQPGKNKPFGNGEPDDCSLCQAAVHASAVVTALFNVLAPDAMFFTTAPVLFALVVHVLYPGHDKEQRGPPGL